MTDDISNGGAAAVVGVRCDVCRDVPTAEDPVGLLCGQIGSDGLACTGVYLAAHLIEERVGVYVELDHTGRWVISAATVDGAPLDGRGPSSEACECGQPQQCQRVRDAALRVPLPTAQELVLLLLERVLDVPPQELDVAGFQAAVQAVLTAREEMA